MSALIDEHRQGNPLIKSWHRDGYTVVQSREGRPAHTLETAPLIIPHPSLQSYLGIGCLAVLDRPRQLEQTSRTRQRCICFKTSVRLTQFPPIP